MEPWLIAILVKSFFLLAFLSALAAARICIKRFMPESSFKRLLLRPV